MMKRVLQHIAFWLCYMLLCMFMEYLWVSKVVTDMPMGYLLQLNIVASIMTITLPEICFAYYLMYRGYDRLIHKEAPLLLTLAEILLAILVSLLLIRSISYFMFSTVLYNRQLADDNFFDSVMILRSFIYLGFSSGLAVSFWMYRKQLAAKVREHDLLEQKLGAELKALRSQLNPHFLFNTLNNIYALARKKSDSAPEAVMKLSDLLSFMLYKADKEMITLNQEISFLEDYIALEKIRYNERLKLKFDRVVEDGTKVIVPLILLPLIENAFKHGASESRFEINIDILIKQQGSELTFTIANSFEKDANPEDGGKIGLRNIQRQLELLYKDYSLEIKNENNIYTVELTLNLDSYGKT